MKLATLPLCLVLAVQAAGAQVQTSTQSAAGPKQLPLACQGLRIPAEILVGSDMTMEALPGRDYADVVRTCRSQAENFLFKATPIPPPQPVASNWLEADRRIYTELLAAQGADILLVPLQVQGYGFDRIERSLMTAELAHALGPGVAEPFLVARALGEGRRRFTEAEVWRLAERIKAKRIVMGYVGHWDRNAMNVTIKSWTPSNGTPKDLRQKDWRAVGFSHEDLPHRSLRRVLPEIVAHLGVKTAAAGKSSDNTAVFAAKITETPEQLAAGPSKQMAASSSLLLLASLAPSADERTRERLFERALMTSLEFDGQHARSRFTQAFALMNLERRPAALRLLKDEQQPPARALRELLNGNLPQAEAAVQTVKSPFEKLLLALALQDLRLQYKKELPFEIDAASKLFAGAADAWRPFIELRAEAGSKWSAPAALKVKVLLDRVQPLAGFDADTVINGGIVVLDDVGEVEMDIATARHLRKTTQLLVGNPSPRIDWIWLLEGIAESRIVKDLWHTGIVAALPEQAAARIDRYRAFFDGHPGIAAVEAMNAAMLVTTAVDDEAATWNRRVREQAQLVIENEQGQSQRAVIAMTALGMPSPGITMPLDIYGYDYPRRSYWPAYFINMESDYLPAAAQTKRALALEALAFSRADMDAVAEAYVAAGQDRQSLDKDLDQRFFGAPGRRQSAAVASATAAPADPSEQFRAMIAANPNEWGGYYALGLWLIRNRGAYEEAARTFMSFPPFKSRAVLNNTVAVANDAYFAASQLYWEGYPELAKPLLQISADLDTGAESSLHSAALLHLIENDHLAAARASLDRANRYPSAVAYRNYLSLLHVMGYGEQAWLGFTKFASQFDMPQLWTAAMVGHQMEGMDATTVRNWLLRPEIRTATFRGHQFALDYALMWNATDREQPVADLGKWLDAIEGEPVAVVGADGVEVLRPHPISPNSSEMLRPTPLPKVPLRKLPAGTRVRSSLAHFADAYVPLRRGDYAAATNAFRSYVERFPLEGMSAEPYVISYMAAAAAKVGDPLGLETYLDSRHPSLNVESFDYWLAKAYFHSQRKQMAEAEAALKSALHSMPGVFDARPMIVQFQYAAACEWIYRESGDERFKRMLLDWVKRHQRIQPVYAWAYAMQYTYETEASARERALAMTLYLDPKSHRIAKAKPNEITKAQAWLEQNKPFQRKGIPAMRAVNW